jgi:hypothetical protein
MNREINQNNVVFYHQIHKFCQRTEKKIDHRFNELTRRLDKMATTDEASTVQFKSALEQHHQMTSMIGDLVDKRNKEVKFTMTATQVKSKQTYIQQQTSTPVTENPKPDFRFPPPGLSPISASEVLRTPFPDDDQSKPVHNTAYTGSELGPSALLNTSAEMIDAAAAGISSQPTMHHMYNQGPTGPPVQVNQPQPTFMTPVLTTQPPTLPSRTSGINDNISRAPAETNMVDSNQTDRSREKQRKSRDRNDSSSDSSLDREYTRWHVHSGSRDRSRSPQLLKMQVLSGRGLLTWVAFIYQFETMGKSQTGVQIA